MPEERSIEILYSSEEYRTVLLSRDMSPCNCEERVLRLELHNAEIILFKQYEESRQLVLTADEMDVLATAWLEWRAHCDAVLRARFAEEQERIERLRARAEALGGRLEERPRYDTDTYRFYLLFPPDSCSDTRCWRFHDLQGVMLDRVESELDEIDRIRQA